MLKAMYGQEWLCGVSRGSVLSSQVRHGIPTSVEGSTAGSAIGGTPKGYCRICTATHISWRGIALCGRALRGEVLYSKVRRGNARQGFIRRGLAWLDIVRPSPARQCKVRSFVVWPGLVQWCIAGSCHLRWGSITVLQGLALYGTVQSCPVLYSRVRSCVARFSELDLLFGMAERGPVQLAQVRFGSLVSGKVRFFEAWYGVVQRSPVLLGQVVLGSVWYAKVRRFVALRGPVADGWCTVERGFVLYGKVKYYLVWSCEVLIGAVGFVGALHSEARFYYGLVRSCLVLRSGAGHCILRFLCGMVWSREALHRIVKFGPVKYCRVSLGIFWHSDVRWGGVWLCLVW